MPASSYSPAVKYAVPSPQGPLSIVFGMGTWVTSPLWTPVKNVKKMSDGKSMNKSATEEIISIYLLTTVFPVKQSFHRREHTLIKFWCFIKNARFFYSRRLAAAWWEKGGQASRHISNTKLKSLLILHLYPIKLVVFKQSSGIKDPGTSNLQGGLALRCFQRLSFPDIATQRCHCSDNWNTRGQSFPVLSY